MAARLPARDDHGPAGARLRPPRTPRPAMPGRPIPPMRVSPGALHVSHPPAPVPLYSSRTASSARQPPNLRRDAVRRRHCGAGHPRRPPPSQPSICNRAIPRSPACRTSALMARRRPCPARVQPRSTPGGGARNCVVNITISEQYPSNHQCRSGLNHHRRHILDQPARNPRHPRILMLLPHHLHADRHPGHAHQRHRHHRSEQHRA